MSATYYHKRRSANKTKLSDLIELLPTMIARNDSRGQLTLFTYYTCARASIESVSCRRGDSSLAFSSAWRNKTQTRLAISSVAQIHVATMQTEIVCRAQPNFMITESLPRISMSLSAHYTVASHIYEHIGSRTLRHRKTHNTSNAHPKRTSVREKRRRYLEYEYK